MIGQNIDKVYSGIPSAYIIHIKNRDGECVYAEYDRFKDFIEKKNARNLKIMKDTDKSHALNTDVNFEHMINIMGDLDKGICLLISTHYKNKLQREEGVKMAVLGDKDLREELKEFFPKELYVEGKGSQGSFEKNSGERTF